MDKVLVFSNYGSWFRGFPKIAKRVDWYDSYPVLDNPLTLCITEQGTETTLRPVDNLSAEGVYLVFDQINKKMLAPLLDACKQNKDKLFILIHTKGCYTHTNEFESWKEICFFEKGMHQSDKEKETKYEQVFNILTDKEGDKLNRIFNSVFKPVTVNDFVTECLEPNKKLENLLSYQVLCEKGYSEALEEFRKKYESCESFLEYSKDLERVRDLLTSNGEK